MVKHDKSLADWGDPETDHVSAAWRVTKEKILMAAGITIMGYTVIVAPILRQDFHYEFLLAGLALCGISIAGWGDKK